MATTPEKVDDAPWKHPCRTLRDGEDFEIEKILRVQGGYRLCFRPKLSVTHRKLMNAITHIFMPTDRDILVQSKDPNQALGRLNDALDLMRDKVGGAVLSKEALKDHAKLVRQYEQSVRL